MIEARKIRDLEGFTGDAALFRLSEPVEYEPGERTNFVVVSATVAMFSGPETYIFPSDESGEVIDWGELEGSFRGGLDHEQAIQNAGWILVKE